MVDWSKYSEDKLKESKEAAKEEKKENRKKFLNCNDKLLEMLEEVRFKAEDGSMKQIEYIELDNGMEYKCNNISLIFSKNPQNRGGYVFEYDVKFNGTSPQQYTQNVKNVQLVNLDTCSWITGRLTPVTFTKKHVEDLFEILLSQATK